MALETAPQRSTARRWTARGLVVGAITASALAAGIATAGAAEVPHVDDHGLSDMLAEHGLHITLLDHDSATSTKSEKADEKSSKKDEKKDKD